MNAKLTKPQLSQVNRIERAYLRLLDATANFHESVFSGTGNSLVHHPRYKMLVRDKETVARAILRCRYHIDVMKGEK